MGDWKGGTKMKPKCYSYIRFSTPEQIKGDSLRRQLKMSEDYANEKGLELDQSMRDLGLSAFKGEQKTKGALGRFLVLVKDGKIPRGSTLIVESLDRLSREQVLDALDQLRDILRAGIHIVTLADRMEYTHESINANIGQLMFSLVIMSRANEESATKSMRGKASWSSKRSVAAQTKMSARAPAWLKLSADRTMFHIIPDRAEIINRIFREKLTGKGSRQIIIGLNQQTAWLPDKQKRKDGPPGWRESYIQKILRSRAVLGEYQPRQVIRDAEGRKGYQPIGEPIKDYFPAVVPEKIFYEVQARLDQDKARLGHGGGRQGAINNLFGHLAKCGYCGAPFAFEKKGAPRLSYLVCDSARRRLSDCKRNYVQYNEFEEMILTYCKGLNPADLLLGHEEQESVLHALQSQLLSVQSKAKEAAAKVNNLSDTIATTDSVLVRQTLEKKLGEALEEQAIYEAEAKQLSHEIERLSRTNEVTETRLESLRELLTFLKEHAGDELIDIRRRLREELRGLIERIEVYPVGLLLMTPERVEKALKEIMDSFPDIDKEWFKARFESQINNKKLRKFIIHFKGGSIRTLEPATAEELVMELDREGGRVLSMSHGVDGKTEWEVVSRLN